MNARKGNALWSFFFPGREVQSHRQYRALRINLILLMILVTVIPLAVMYVISYHEYRKVFMEEMVRPLRVLINKAAHSFDLFLAERRSAVSFIASAYTYEELSDQQTLHRIFQVMKREFGGFVDLGLINSSGLQVSYVGPYQLIGKDYSIQEWFQEVEITGTYISDVFMGYRRYPHFVIAVQHMMLTGGTWTVRSTIDTEKFNSLIDSMGLEAGSDAFLLNKEGILQTPSKFYGQVLEKFPIAVPPSGTEPEVVERKDPDGQQILLGSVRVASLPFTLVMVKLRENVMKPWHIFRNKLSILFMVSVLIIFIVMLLLIGLLFNRIENLERKNLQAFQEMEYTGKLASIGRLAAGVSHEINNPMAIIDQKAGLMTDLIEQAGDFPDREKFLNLTGSIAKAVDRCRAITHRLLGFARRMDVEFTFLNLNEVIREVHGFLEKEASQRNVEIELNLHENLPLIRSDQGQLQQVFLNILNNALEAVDTGGQVTITSFEHGGDAVAVAIRDNGSGMSKETAKHIFEPFFTTKKGYGTGLGLSITYGIVKKLGGDIQVQSREGQGTTFTVILAKSAEPGLEK